MVTRTKKYPIWVDTAMSFDDPLPQDKVRLLPRNHPLRTREETADVLSEVHATIEVKVKEGSPLAANLDDVDVSVLFMEDLDDMENHKEFLDFIWDELAKGHTVEMKLIWPSDDELKKGVERARHVMPVDKLKELAYSGRVIDGDEALQLGLLTALHDDPLMAAREMAAEIAAKSPEAVAAMKKLFNSGWDLPVSESLSLEAALQSRLMGSENQLEAAQANLNRRSPEFKN